MKKPSFISLVASTTILFALTACNAPSLPQAPKEEVLQNIKDVPAPNPYLLQIGDTLDIKVRFNPELDESVIIPPDGVISTSLANDVPAYGRTTKELRDDLVKQYAKELSNPSLSVIMRSFAPNRVYVTGEVYMPGEFVTAGPSLTLLQAVSRAGGLKNSAGTDKIIIIRHNAGKAATAYATNFDDAMTGYDPSSDVRLAPYDVVFVPRSDIGNVYLYFQQFVQQFVPAGFGLSYQLNPQRVN